MMRNVLEYLETSARSWPDKTAYEDERERFSFREVLLIAKAIGSALADQHGECNRPVAVETTRDARCVIAFFGVLFSGNYYVPLDAQMPAARRERILQTLQPAEILDPAALPQFGQPEKALLAQTDEALLAERRERILDSDPVYAIFTSGSTGDPKGIVIAHRSVIDFTDWFVKAGAFSEKDVLGNQAPFYFDLSVKDLYTAAATGATVQILPRKLFLFPKLLVEWLQQRKVTALVWATSAFHLVANSGVLDGVCLPELRTVILGGEALRARQLNRWRKALPDVRYINLYGPTEVTVDCTWYPIEREFGDEEDIPIGRACANKEVFLLGEDGKVCEPGEVGEICVRGSGLAKGYFGDWEKTHASFIQDPRNPHYPDPVYRTGDLGVWEADGLLHFRARKDGQIKHMGYRIELGEIETALAALPGVEEAACFFDSEKDKIHCAYSGTADAAALAKALRTRLPKYMLPNLYHPLETLPHNANGKIDRKRLREEWLSSDPSNN